jgi:hypothetical protein
MHWIGELLSYFGAKVTPINRTEEIPSIYLKGELLAFTTQESYSHTLERR